MKGEWEKFAYKLFGFTAMKQQATAMTNLSTSELVSILEVV